MKQPKEAFYAHLKYFVVYRDIKGKHSTQIFNIFKKKYLCWKEHDIQLYLNIPWYTESLSLKNLF